MMAPDGDMDKIAANVSSLGNGDLTPNASEPNAMKTQYSAGIGSGSASSGSWSFQFFVHNDDGLSLSVDLNSDPLDWMRACSNGIRVPQHIHRSKPMPVEEGSTRGQMVPDSNNSEGTLVDGFYKRSLSEQVGISGIDKSSTGCIGKEVLANLEIVPDGSKATGNLREQRVVYEGTNLNHGVLNDSGQEPGDQKRFRAHKNTVPGVLRQPEDVEMIGRGISSGYRWDSRDQQCVQAYEAMQNENGEISRNLQGGGPSENTLEEMNNSQSTKDFQNSEESHKIEVKTTRKTNLRTLKTLARGPIVLSDDDTKERRRRKSARLTDKDLL